MWTEDSNSCLLDTDGDDSPDISDVDNDGNGLIEITTAAMLDNMRYNPAGTSYDDEQDDSPTTDAPDADEGDKTGCGGQGGITVCNGYELSNDITLTENWIPIGATFTGTFDGKGYSISGITISSNNQYVGFFNQVSGTVRNTHLRGMTGVTNTNTNPTLSVVLL